MKNIVVYFNVLLSVAVLLLTIKLASQDNEKNKISEESDTVLSVTENMSDGVSEKSERRKLKQIKKKAAKSNVYTINTTSLCADVKGFIGPTPVEITIENGKIKNIEALKNDETPKFFQKVEDSGLLKKWNGKTIEEGISMKVDAVTGATFSSKALIENVRCGLKEAGNKK